MLGVPSALTCTVELAPALRATSRTRATTSSSGNCVDGLTRDISELRSQTAGVTAGTAADLPRGGGGAMSSQVTNDTSASGSAAGVWSSPATESARSFCGLYGGILAEGSVTVSERLPVMRI